MEDLKVPRHKPRPEFLWLFFQCDARFVLVFFRSGPGEGIIPPHFPFYAFFWITLAGLLWEYFGHVGGSSGWGSPFGVFAIVVFLKSLPMARENARRKKQQCEIRPMMFVGWPRYAPWQRYCKASGAEQTRIWRTATHVKEPLEGLLWAGLGFAFSAPFGLYLFVLVVLLWRDSAAILYRERAERIRLQDAMAREAHLQRLLEEVDSRRRSPQAFDAAVAA